MKWMPRAVGLVVVLAAAPNAAAIEVPQNRKEFVVAVAAGARGAATERFVVDQGLEQVYRLLKERSATCLDVVVRRSGWVGGYVENSSSDYTPTLRMLGPKRAEFTLQVAHRPRGVGHTPPPGGLYMMAADLRAVGPRRTEVVLYHPTIGYKKLVAAFRKWAAGEKVDCPKMR